MFRYVVAALAVIGLLSLFSGGSVLGIGAILLAPFFFIAKVVFFMMMFGFFARAFGGRSSGRRGHYGGNHWKGAYSPGRDQAAAFGRWGNRPPHWAHRGRSGRWQAETSEPADPTRFEEWQAMNEARQEVDGWVEDLERN